MSHQKFKQMIGYRERKNRQDLKDKASHIAPSQLAVSDLDLVKSEEEIRDANAQKTSGTLDERRASSATHNKR